MARLFRTLIHGKSLYIHEQCLEAIAGCRHNPAPGSEACQILDELESQRLSLAKKAVATGRGVSHRISAF